MPKSCVNDPSQEISSTDNCPVVNGVSSDCRVTKAGDNQPRPHPAPTVAKLAAHREDIFTFLRRIADSSFF